LTADTVSRTLTILTTIFLIFLALAILGGLLWANTLYARDNPGEKDFFVPWLAARTFLQYGDSPYGDSATQRAQVVYYGRLAAEDEDPLRLSVPFPVELFYFPFALITDYAIARSMWMTCLEIALVAMAFLSLRLTGWKPARALLPGLLIFSVLWVYGFLPLAGNRAVIFVALAIVGLLLALRDGHDELAGALLVVPFFKPDIAGFLVLVIFWWAIYHRRGRLVAGFLMVVVILLAVSFFILSDWFMPFIGGLISQFNYHPGLTPGGILASWWPAVGPRLGLALTGLLLVVLYVEWRDLRRKDLRHLLWTASLTLAVTPLLGISVTPQDYVLLFFPLVLFLSILTERWSRPGRWGVAGFVLLVIFFGFWIITAGLFLAGNFATLTAVLTLIFPALLVLGLYWMRWWAVRPPRTWSDSLP
jgi:hypothetical protein